MKLADDCNLCTLRQNCTHVYWGDGNPNASIMVVGEYPKDYEADTQVAFGHPKREEVKAVMVEAGIDLADCYFTYTVKCRQRRMILHPKQYCFVTADQILACLPYLRHEIRTVKPKVFVAFGKLAAQVLAGLPEGLIIKEYAGHVLPCVEQENTPVVLWHPGITTTHRSLTRDDTRLMFIKVKELAYNHAKVAQE